MKSISQQITWPKVTYVAFVALVTAVAPGSLVAQSGDVPDLSGNWLIERQPYSCGEWNLDQFGNVRAGCAISVDQLPLNRRARAWAEFYDEPMAAMWDCVPASLPSLLGDSFPWNLNQKSDRITIWYEHDDTVRTVWMDGRRHPFVGELFYMGHSIGWYEGETLVIETTNFTFDPDGMDDHGHIATSVRKRLTERYTQTGPDNLEMAITLEDPLFLTEPYTWVRQLNRSDVGPQSWGECDLDQSRRQLESLPSKYDEGTP